MASAFPIAIIGAGFSGIGTAIQLLRAGNADFTIFERAAEIGGTWRDNHYPGAACDVPSHVYSLSFEPYPGWTRKYSPAAEIQAYLLRLVEKWKLRDKLRLGTAIASAHYDEARGEWRLLTERGDEHRARVVVSCVGGLVDPATPDIPGLADFRGDLFHTARWRHEVPLAKRRVGVIGTGASAVQVVPSLAPEVAQLCVFQRTPAWVVPKLDERYSEQQLERYAKRPFALRASRLAQYWTSELLGPMVFLDSKRLSGIGERMSLAHLRRQVKDPALRAKLTPGFQFGCKRILISDDYWASFERPNVELVCDPIARVRPEGIETRDGRLRALDAIVLATGFDVNLSRAPFAIHGRGGRSLDEAWQRGGVAYRGLSVAGFPNWFILMGPNTGPGHTSVLIYSEAQIAHVLGAIRTLAKRGLKSIEVRRDAQDRYDAGLQRRMKYMVWSSCQSWYLSPDGSNHTLYPGLAAEYALRTRRFRARNYQLET
jgi:cation diffusion facilitator CzcD-associated flavoprotein CzcO